LQGTRVVAKFSVVVVFDNASPVVSRELDQCLTAARRQRHAEGKLVEWTDTDHTDIARQLFDHQSFLVDPNRHDSCAG
jgi:hypothetical protein